MKLHWYSIEEVAKKEGVSRRRVRQKLDKGDYANVREGFVKIKRHEIGLPETK